MIELPEPDVIAELQGCYVINKPGGLLTQGPPGIDSLELRIKSFVKKRDDKPGKVYLGVPHRLDRPASGVMLFAKNIRAAKRIALQFQERTVTKTYWAVVEGEVLEAAGVWEDSMRKLPDQAKSEVCDADHPKAQHARLSFRVLAVKDKMSWLEIQLETGRTHQIRLQASHRGHPILGDELYKSSAPFGPETLDTRKRWIALHARTIGFEHPMTQEQMEFSAELADHWGQLPFEFS